MVPKKFWFVLKILVLVTLFLLVQSFFRSLSAQLGAFQRDRQIRRYPIASLFQEDVQPIISQQCRNHVTIHNHVLIEFSNITLNPNMAHAKAQGGAMLTNIDSQSESDEIFNVQQGFLSLPCQDHDLDLNKRMLQDLNDHLEQWRDSIIVSSRENYAGATKPTQRGLTIIVERWEYANVYWTLMDLYDVYLTMQYLNHTFHDTNILLMDARPRGHLDELWSSFHTVTRLQDVKVRTTFEKLTWRFDRNNSPLLNDRLQHLPHIDKFQQFVIQSQHIKVIPPKIQDPNQCSNLRILFIWRHEYVAHPRNKEGAISRKITNEQGVLNATRVAFPMHKIQGVQLDKYDVTEQLTFIANCDVMVGMHGAAMSYSVFLPPGAAVIEMFPEYYGDPNWHMKKLAKWSHHEYYKHRLSYKQDDVEKQTTVVPPEVVIDLLTKASASVCMKRIATQSPN